MEEGGRRLGFVLSAHTLRFACVHDEKEDLFCCCFFFVSFVDDDINSRRAIK